MFSNKVASVIQELLVGNTFPIYYVDQVPPYDQVKNLSGFVVWDIEEVTPMHCTEGVAYAAGTVLNFHLAITVYGSKMITRNSIERQILDILQPQDLSGRRVPLQQEQKMNAFIRYMIWSSITEFPIPKTAQSNAEMSASVLMFNSSISVSE